MVISTVRAVVCAAYGEPGSLRIGEVERAPLGPREVRVRVRKAGVNFPDILIIQGKYQLKPPMPFAPGFEVAGEIIELDPAIEGLDVGDRVMGLTSSGYGGFAEEAVIHGDALIRIPDGIDYASAMALLTAYGTSYHGLVQRGQLKAGETLVVLGASGSVGLAAVEIGKALGARVIAVGRSETRLEKARACGADALLSYEDGDFKARILELTGGKGADVCIDMLGGAPFGTMSRCMNYNGRLLVVGFTTGEIPTLAANLVLLKGYQLVGVWWAEFIKRDPAGNQDNFRALFKLTEQGLVRPTIAHSYPLDQVPAALERLSSRTATGKIAIDID